MKLILDCPGNFGLVEDELAAKPVTDIALMSHGWKGNAPLATQQCDDRTLVMLAGTTFLTWGRDGTARLWDICVNEDWPISTTSLRVETGTTLTHAEWNRKRCCEYDPIRRDLKHLSDADRGKSQRRCEAPGHQVPATSSFAAAAPEAGARS